MSTKVKHCGCKYCRLAMRTKNEKARTRHIQRAARHRWNLAARMGDQDKATATISIPPPY